MPQPKKSQSSGRRKQAAGKKPASSRKPATSTSSKPAASKRKPAASSRTPAASKGKAPASSRKPAASKRKQTTSTAPRDEARANRIAALRDMLTRGVVVTGDRVQEAVDDAVKRGRMTRKDAEDFVASLVAAGRKQTEELLAELDSLLDRGRETAEETGKRARTKAGAAARRPPGTDKVLQQVDRARRAAGLGSSFPITGFDELTAAQVNERLTGLTPAELRKVRDHEKRNANRKSVLGAVDKRLG